MRCSIVMLKFNFGFILFLQTVKFLLGKDTAALLAAPPPTSIQTNSHATLFNTSSFPMQLQQKSVTITNDVAGFLASLLDFYTYDIDQIEATKTDLIKIYDSKTKTAAGEQNKPYVTVSSFLNLNEMFQFSNLRNMIKVILAMNLNLAIVLVNILILCHLLLRRRPSRVSTKRAGMSTLGLVLSGQLVMNLTVLVFMLVLNTAFMLLIHKHHRAASSTFSNLNKTLMDFFTRQLTRKQNLVDLKNFLLVDSRIKLTKTNSALGVEIAGGSGSEDSSFFRTGVAAAKAPNETPVDMTLNNSFIYLNINIVIMVLSSFLLLCYSYFLNHGDEEENANADTDQLEKQGIYYFKKLLVFRVNFEFFYF
jgi:hypothetical protein